MAQGSALPVTIAGAGVFGLATAVELAGRGHRVDLFDPAAAGTSASAVAAGLLSPIGEAVFDASSRSHFPLLAAAMECWPAFAAASGIDVAKAPTRVPAELGEAIRPLDPGFRLSGGYGWYERDARVADPPRALAQLRRRLVELGGRIVEDVLLDAPGEGATILAVGPGADRVAPLAPELLHLTPIKGQIAVLPHGPMEGPTVRWRGGYIAPQPGGARVGATMEVGCSDLTVEAGVIAGLVDRARSELSSLNSDGADGQAGVRMATPDGLPMVGPSRKPGVWIVAGARRNGWLLAPLVAKLIAAYLAGDDPGPWASALHPGRFDQP